MQTSINKRIKAIVDYIGKPINSIAKEVKVSQPTLKACVDGNNKPSFDTIQKLLSVYSEINPTWLMNGTGEMLLDKTGKNTIQLGLMTEEEIKQQDKEVAEGKWVVSSLNPNQYIDKICELAAKNALLERENENLKKEIDILKSQIN